MADENKILFLEAFGLLKEFDSVEKTRAHIQRTISKLGNEIVFDYRRFQWMAATVYWRIEILDFNYIDNVLVGLRKAMEKNFSDWGIKIKVSYKEKG
ncbi:hypothetical protein LCGC14_0954810 [marine sediment metagenome]|uniref:Uncharacterized protein n=1 Tax=marine sediment metagenome TaxID=412755 RepID=A0A0F9P2B9_9ZZZZ|nr:hypothetical protein [bacterium]